jgi:hypothetical protein
MNRNPALTFAVDMLVAPDGRRPVVTHRRAQGAPIPAPRPGAKAAFPLNRYPALTLAIEVLLILTLSYGPLLLSISL